MIGLTEKIKPESFCRTLLGHFRGPKKSKMLDRTFTMINKELDLVKVIRKIKMLVLSSFGTLTFEQRRLVIKASELVVTSGCGGDSSSGGSHSESHLEGRGELKKAISRLQSGSAAAAQGDGNSQIKTN